MESSERISESQATLEEIDSSVLFEFEVRSERDPVTVANFKFSTLEGWRRLTSGVFDAVLLDLDMPRLSGRELIMRIKADAELRNLPILIVSGRKDFESIEAAFVGGAFVFCPKPVNWSLLRTQLQSSHRGDAPAEARLSGRVCACELEQRFRNSLPMLGTSSCEFRNHKLH
jgi:CheY-like chemotaxis protein